MFKTNRSLIAVFLTLSALAVTTVYFLRINLPVHKESYKREAETHQVVFAKVHKAASSTIQNILLRFAEARGLDVLLPKEGTHINECTPIIDPHSLIWQPKRKPFDILSNHLIFDEVEISKYIPRSAFRFGILREPLSQTLSALKFYATFYLYPGTSLDKAMKKYWKDPIQGFLDHPGEFCNEYGNIDHCFIDNRMSIDLGFSTLNMYSNKRNKKFIQKFVDGIDRQFDLMLIFEYFDESMILLRRYMHWKMKDIIYLKVNAALYKSKYVWRSNLTLTPVQTNRFKQWAAVDITLYDHFLDKFLRKTKTEVMLNEEVLAFKQICSNISMFCNNRGRGVKRLKIPQSPWTEEFSVTLKNCALMMRSEEELVTWTRAQQIARHREAYGVTVS